MDDLTAFIDARLDEDEAAAIAAGDGAAESARWRTREHPSDSGIVRDGQGAVVIYDEGVPSDEDAAHIARHDPDRALRDVAAKRAILALYDNPEGYAYSVALERVVVQLATAWSDHPDYRQEWAPDRALPRHGGPREDLRHQPAHRTPVGSRGQVAAHRHHARAVLAGRRPGIVRAAPQARPLPQAQHVAAA